MLKKRVEHISWPFNGVFFIAILLFTLFIPTPSFSASDYYLKLKNSDEKIVCEKVYLKDDSFYCNIDGVSYLYSVDKVETVSVSQAVIYPYVRNLQLTDTDLLKKDCEYIKKNVMGPLFLENRPEVFLLVGTMFEHGKCVTKNTDRALRYYQKAGHFGETKFYALQNELHKQKPKPTRAKIDPQVLITLQQQSDLSRIKKNAQEKVCNVECSYKLDEDFEIQNKFRINTQCFQDCMHSNGYLR